MTFLHETLESFETGQNDVAIVQRLHPLAVTAGWPQNRGKVGVNDGLLLRILA